VAGATEFISSEIGSDVVITGLYRHDLPRLPQVVIREAIANAVAHRSYEAHGTAIVIDLRRDAVVVTSPGGLPEPVTVDNLRQAQAARNQHVIDVLRRFRLAEDAGRGVDVMQDSMEEALLDPPRFEDLGGSVRVTLPLLGAITARERAWVSDLERRGEIHASDRLLLVHSARGEKLTNGLARDILRVGAAEARESLQRLRDAGLIVQHGTRGGASYTLIEELAPPAAFRMTPAQIEDLLVSQAEERPLTQRNR
jgi:ATP-dependent DNA helicase RecG